jgi:CBS domain-containing protein
MKLKEIMTGDVEVISPTSTIKEAAEKLGSLNIGALPVCDDDKLVGMVTDRDIVVKGIARGIEPSQCQVKEVMTHSIVYAFEESSIRDAARLMKDKQVRRVVVLDSNKKLVGIVSLGDLATKLAENVAGETLSKVSEQRKSA